MIQKARSKHAEIGLSRTDIVSFLASMQLYKNEFREPNKYVAWLILIAALVSNAIIMLGSGHFRNLCGAAHSKAASKVLNGCHFSKVLTVSRTPSDSS